MSTWIPGLTRKCVVPAHKTKDGNAKRKEVFPDFDSAFAFLAAGWYSDRIQMHNVHCLQNCAAVPFNPESCQPDS